METALAHAMNKAGVNTKAALLHQIAVDKLRKTDREVSRAVSPFVDAIRHDTGLLSELARAYLDGVADDMLRVPAKAGDGVQPGRESQQGHGPVESSEGEGSVRIMTSQQQCGPSPSDSVPAKAGGGVQVPNVRQFLIGSPNIRSGAVPRATAGQTSPGRVVPIPNKPRGLEAMETRARVNSIFDSYMMRDGIPIGNVVFSALPRLESANAREAALIKLIRNHVRSPGNPNAKVRDLINETQLQRMIQKAAEITSG